MPDPTAPGPVPESRVLSRKRTGISPVWIIPLVAAVAGVWVAATRILGAGPHHVRARVSVDVGKVAKMVSEMMSPN